MPSYRARTFKDGQILYARDINKIEKQLELLSSKLNLLSLTSNIWIDTEEPEDKSVLWIDLGDNAATITSELNEIFNEYSQSINYLSSEVNKLKEIIASGGIISPIIPPQTNPDIDCNNYLLIEDNTELVLLMENGIPFLLENDFEYDNNIGEDTVIITNAFLGEDGIAMITEEGLPILLDGYNNDSNNDNEDINVNILSREILDKLYTMI